MARSRSPTLYPEKRAKLLKVAQRMFLKHGYEGTSMAKLAREAGVAANTIYWYFADKDALLVDVLNVTMLGMTGAYLSHVDEPLQKQLLWLMEVFRETRQLVSTVHTRASVSPAIAEWHERFHAFFEAAMVEQMRRRGVPQPRARQAAKIAGFVLEGVLSHDVPPRECRELIDTLVDGLQLTSQPS